MFTHHSNDKHVMAYAGSLAHQGLFKLETEEEAWLFRDVDLSLVPTDHQISLAACVTAGIVIRNVRGCDLVNIFKGVKTKRVNIKRQTLGREETQALVQAVETRVKKLGLGYGTIEDVKVDIQALLEYSGQGKCSILVCNGGIVTSHREELEAWAKNRHWECKINQENPPKLALWRRK